MKKILFVIPSFLIGGTSTSLINLISKMDKTKYQINIYAISYEGPLEHEIKKFGTIINSRSSTKNDITIYSRIKRICFRWCKKIFRYLRKNKVDLTNIYIQRVAQSLSSKDYDCIIAYQEGICTKLVSFCTSKKKIAWIHSNYKRYLELSHNEPEQELYYKYDVIVNVSRTANDVFISSIPQLSNKCTYIFNLLDSERISLLSKDRCPIDISDSFTLISIGRIDPVKRFSFIPSIAAKLKSKGTKFRWLILGGATTMYPNEYNELIKGIKSNHLEKEVISLGYISNPYPYIKNSNLLVSLSSSETFNYTVLEARILGIPVVATDYLGVDEFLKEGEGCIVSNIETIPDKLYQIISDVDYFQTLKDQLISFSYDNKSILNKIYREVF